MARDPKGRLRAAWTLALLTTVCAELTFTAVAVPFAWLLLPLLLVMYGAGVLLVRELAVRAGGGWPGLVLLGLAYQLAEDGLGLQALTSPNIYGAADWGWRALGANWSYWASQVGVHVVFSVLVPVLLTDLVFPGRRGRPYLRTGGLVGVGLLAVLGVVGLRVVISGTEDPGYLAPWGWTAAFVVAIAVLGLLALRVAPGFAVPGPRPAAAAPRPPVVAAAAGSGTVVFLALLIPPGLGPRTLVADGVPPAIPLVAAALVGLGLAWATLRWSAAPGWGDRHRIWLAGGILVGHTAFMLPGPPANAVTGGVVIVLEVALLALLARHVARRPGARHGPREHQVGIHPL
ncbi:hypothetical protein [Promicromonospora sp. NPDC057488]|uniref:hypothetical protein n=1 Tax=Promicromonospora sp. NPDC057488 TaxID=3346147 RepID=UPI00366AA560